MTQVSGDPSYYEVLGVAPTATADEVKSAYRRLSRQIHPDVGGNGALFRLVSAAYETLSDPGQRAAYDRSLKQGRQPSSPPPKAEPRKEDVASKRQAPRRRAVPARSEAAVRRRRMAAGAALGGLWYLLRATGLLNWAMGSRAASRWLPAAVESWARPFTLAKLLLCMGVAIVAVRSSSVRRFRIPTALPSGGFRAAVFGAGITATLCAEYLFWKEGQSLVLAGSAIAFVIILVPRRALLRAGPALSGQGEEPPSRHAE